MGFNPSVEGKPLQLEVQVALGKKLLPFQSLCRGEASATTVVGFEVLVDTESFNPSVEGKPLQLQYRDLSRSSLVFQSLCRGEASATMLNL